MWTMTTRVLVAGASGTLGRPVVGALLTGGYHVVGLTRAPSKRHLIESLGGAAVVADALDADALRAAVQRAAPDVVVHLLTALPRRPVRGRLYPAAMTVDSLVTRSR
jgi:nucleoside-diphosphate-sugar epimerase